MNERIRYALFAGIVLQAIGCRTATSAPDAPIISSRPPIKAAIAAPPTPRDTSASDTLPKEESLPPDLPKIAVILEDPRLTNVRERVQSRDFIGAARALESSIASDGVEGTEISCGRLYLAGRFYLQSAMPREAYAAFDRACAPGSGLRTWAKLRAAEAALRSGLWKEAAVAAGEVGTNTGARDEAQFALADAHLAKGERGQAVPLWRDALQRSPSGARWVETAGRLASALIDGEGGSPKETAKEAFDLSTRLLLEAPKVADKFAAEKTRAKAARLLKVTAELSPAERARRAQSWLDANDADNARSLADSVLAQKKAPRDVACRAAITRAQATEKAKREAAWDNAIARCKGDEMLANALFLAGKSSLGQKLPNDAILRFKELENIFPKHRFADDARFHTAMATLSLGNEQRAITLLSSIADTYPDGDMKSEALFRVALAQMVSADWPSAKATLDRLIALTPNDRGWATAGRAAYFRAKVAFSEGDVADAKVRWASIIREHPLAYYMTQAYARLASLDESHAKTTLDLATTAAPGELFFTREHPELSSDAFIRAMRLLEVGEPEAARKEMSLGGALPGVVEQPDPEVMWTAAYLFDQAGAPEIGHTYSRARLQDHLAHYPVGRWRVAWEAAFPRAFQGIVFESSAAANIPAPLTWAIMREESGFIADIRSHSNAIGLMQLLPSTAREVAKGTGLTVDESSLRKPEISIALGSKMLGSLRRMYFTNPALAIAAYNGGSGSVRRWLDARGSDDFDMWVERIDFEETRAYVKRVLASEAAYAFLYARPVLAEILAIPTRVKHRSE